MLGENFAAGCATNDGITQLTAILAHGAVSSGNS
jgi:hypothetical protein